MTTIAPYGVYQAFDDNGNPLAGGELFTYEAGTTTPKATYTDYIGNVPNTNPVVLDASGMANVWLGDGGYKFVLKDSDGNTIFTVDGIGGTTDAAFGANVNTITSNTIIDATYANSANIVTGNTTLSLQPASTLGEGFYISIKNNGVGNVIIDPDGAETIDGGATKTLFPGDSCLIISTGTAWFSFFLTVSAGGNNTFAGNNTFSGNNTFTGTNSYSNTSTFTGKVITPDDGELTIATGVITVTGVYHTVDTEGDAATDDLVTINGGADGQDLIIRPENDGRTIVLKTSGNIDLPADVTLDEENQVIHLKYDGALSKWLQVSATAKQGALADSAVQSSRVGPVTASGASFDISTSIPSDCVSFKIIYSALSIAGSSTIGIQIGDSGGYETTGYAGGVNGGADGSSNSGDNFSVSILLSGAASTNAAAVLHGIVTAELFDAATNTWVFSGTTNFSNTGVGYGISGTKALTATLDRVRLITGSTFDAGSVSARFIRE